MPDVTVAGATYPDVPAVDLPRADGLGNARYYDPNEILYAASPTSGGPATVSNGLQIADVDSTSTATAFTATVSGIADLHNGVFVILKNGVVASSEGCTINVNSLGAKPIYSSETSERITTEFGVNSTMLFTYDEDRVSGGCWVAFGADVYVLPSGGIPKSDLASGVQGSLDAADSAYQKPSMGIPASDLASGVIPTKTSDLTNDSGYITGMVILSYGSSTWNDFITAYQAKKIVYCRASSNANPASGSQTRLAFMAYVSNADNPANVEFQYYRSVSSHTNAQQGDQVYVYKLTSTGAWSVTVREAYTKIVAGTGLSSSYASGVLTLNNTGGGSSGVTEETISTSGAVSQALDAGKIYHFSGALTALTVTLNAAASGQIAQYHFDFTTGSTVPTLTVPNTVTMPDGFAVEANKRYEIDILNGYGAVMSWAVS